MVILGNPPYNAFAGVESTTSTDSLVIPYKAHLAARWGVKKYNLDDLYVRFMRVAERRIVNGNSGIVSYISNASYVQDPSFSELREHFLREFDLIEIDNLNGDSRETGKRTPDGLPDPSVFSTPLNPAGIQVGTAIGLFVRRPERRATPSVRWREFWGADKRANLLGSLDTSSNVQFAEVAPDSFSYLALRPFTVTPEYRHWPALTDLALLPPENGLLEKRGGGLLSSDRELLAERMSTYFDESLNWSQFTATGHPLAENAARHNAKSTRALVIQKEETLNPARIIRYFLRPFETPWAYYSGVRTLWNEPRPQLRALSEIADNAFLVSRPAGVADPEGACMAFTRLLGDNDALRGHAYYFADRVLQSDGLRSEIVPNISSGVAFYLSAIGLDPCFASASLIWRHALAIGYAGSYRQLNADGLKVRWPRIPMPDSSETLRRSASLGDAIAQALDPQSTLPGVASGNIFPALRVMGLVSSRNLALEGWGSKDIRGRVAPGRGFVNERPYTSVEWDSILSDTARLGLTAEQIFDALGPALDVRMNTTTDWTCVPRRVWDFIIGGYQPIKKWLSYRDRSIIGRELTREEAREVTIMVRRIASIVLLGTQLDENFSECSCATFDWPSEHLAPLLNEV